MNRRRTAIGVGVQLLLLVALTLGLAIHPRTADAQQAPPNTSGEGALAQCQNKHQPGTHRFPDGVEATVGLPYGSSNSFQTGDLFEPTGDGPFPAIVLLHGGGWTVGDKCWLDSQALYFAQNGYVSYTINYRLAPDACYPAPEEDVEAAIKFLRSNASTYQVDPQRIGLLGTSAGGQIAAMVAARQGLGSTGSKVAAIASWSGALDMAKIMQERPDSPEIQTRIPPAACVGAGADVNSSQAQAAISKASPIDQPITRKWPPTFLANAENEFIPLDQAQAMEAKLKDAGVPVTLFTPPTGHATAYTRLAEPPTLDWFNQYVRNFSGVEPTQPAQTPSTPTPTPVDAAGPTSSSNLVWLIVVVGLSALLGMMVAAFFLLRRNR